MPVTIIVDLVLWPLALVEAVMVLLYTMPNALFSVKKTIVMWAASSSSLRYVDNLYYPTLLFCFVVFVAHFYALLFGYDENALSLLQLQQRLFLSAFCMILLRLLKRMYYLLRNNAEAVLTLEESVYERNVREMIQFSPPSLKAMRLQMYLYKWIANPQFSGWENIPEDPSRPLLFVGNHAIAGLEVPLLVYELYKKKQLFVRALGDHTHFKIPLWGKLLQFFGVVDGTREICGMLMQRKDPVLVYPGGARETLKRKSDPKYHLMWKDRMGFARMAIMYRCIIIPIASVGTEDMMEILYDIPAGWLFGGRDLTTPLLKPPSPNKLQRIYFHFGAPIDTAEYDGDFENKGFCEEVRDKAKAALEECIEMLLEKQARDPDRLTLDRLSHSLKELRNTRAQYLRKLLTYSAGPPSGTSSPSSSVPPQSPVAEGGESTKAGATKDRQAKEPSSGSSSDDDSIFTESDWLQAQQELFEFTGKD